MARASKAQAELIAYLWGARRTIPVATDEGGYNGPTITACLNRGWLVSTGEAGTFPSGAPHVQHRVSEDGLDALGEYLRKRPRSAA